jgi:hypothetical protein
VGPFYCWPRPLTGPDVPTRPLGWRRQRRFGPSLLDLFRRLLPEARPVIGIFRRLGDSEFRLRNHFCSLPSRLTSLAGPSVTMKDAMKAPRSRFWMMATRSPARQDQNLVPGVASSLSQVSGRDSRLSDYESTALHRFCIRYQGRYQSIAALKEYLSFAAETEASKSWSLRHEIWVC